jgi:ribosomal protein S18 acetylase RimI-like enzyme
MKIRPAGAADAEGMVALNDLLSRQTSFMLREPAEVQSSVEKQQTVLERISTSNDEHMLVAEEGGKIIGFVAAYRRPFQRVRHSFSLVIGVSKSSWGRGVGGALLGAIEEWVASAGGSRLELTVIAENQRAVSLYTKRGFEIAGVRRRSINLDGKLLDELCMAKLL